MKLFWILFNVILFSGTASIYYYAPTYSATFMPYVPNWMKPQDPTLISTTYITNKIAVTILPKTPPQTDSKKRKEVLPEDESFVSPALEGIYYARASEHPGWGITHQKTVYYNGKGVYLGTIPSGEILKCLKGKLSSSKGDLIECQPLSSTNAPLLIARKDAHFFTGDYNKLATKQVEMLITYYQLNGKIAERRRKLLDEGANLNPHFQASRAAYSELTKNIEDAKQLQQQISGATGQKKIQLDEQLRALKVKETGLKISFEENQKSFVAWKKQHASQLPNPETDPTIQSWHTDKQKLLAALPGLAF